ncbi:MFS general substrate transporter [Mycena pura]|uniref:MFS general substrate transporter n=1 Tax=Mycena pura TaxID=153505 RepID=A0AAD6UM09_9AGAR|nr:MFS general substrate transporter [Mycena pura]
MLLRLSVFCSSFPRFIRARSPNKRSRTTQAVSLAPDGHQHTPTCTADQPPVLPDTPLSSGDPEKLPIGREPPPISELSNSNPEPSRQQIILGRVHTAAMIFAGNGRYRNDGALGPLIPRIQEVYNLGYLVVSLLFVFQSLGSVIGAFVTMTLTPKLGFGKLLIIGPLFQIVGYSLQSAALPYPVFVFASVLNGIGVSILDAQANGYVASFARSPEARMGYTQAGYGAGIFASPLVSTQFAQLSHWSFHYLVSLSLTLLDLLVLAIIFRGKTQNECLGQLGQVPISDGTSKQSHTRQAFSLKALHLMALYLFVLIGVGVANSGWTVTYMVNVRGGGSSSGYIAAGYAGGVVLGRIALVRVNKLVGENRIVYIYTLIAIGLQLIVWLVPSLIGGAISIAFTGLMSGPIYPLALNRSARLFPAHLLTACMSWMAAIGTVGGALVPFIAGAISSRVGIKSLQPVWVLEVDYQGGLTLRYLEYRIVAGQVITLILWTLVPKRIRGEVSSSAGAINDKPKGEALGNQ